MDIPLFDIALIKVVTFCLDVLAILMLIAIPLGCLSFVFPDVKWLPKICSILLVVCVIGGIIVGIPFIYIEGKYGCFPYNGLFNWFLELLGAKRMGS